MATRLKNFTPVMDELVKLENLTYAAVIGLMWRYQQGAHGVCQASQETLGNKLGVSVDTVSKYQKLGVKHGHLKDFSPNLRNKPHTYGVVDLHIIAELVAEFSVPENSVASTENFGSETRKNRDEETNTLKKEITPHEKSMQKLNRKKGDLVDAAIAFLPALEKQKQADNCLQDMIEFFGKQGAIEMSPKNIKLGEWLRERQVEKGESFKKFKAYMLDPDLEFYMNKVMPQSHSGNFAQKVMGFWTGCFGKQEKREESRGTVWKAK